MSIIEPSFYTNLGKVIFLWGRSELHANWPTKLIAQYVYPALTLKQYVILADQAGTPVAYISWANLSLEAELRYLENPHSLILADWNSGNRIWFADLVSPYSPLYTREIIQRLRSGPFKKTVARSLRVKTGSDTSRVAFYWGTEVLPTQRKALLTHYYQSAKSAANSKKIIWDRQAINIE